MDLTAVRSPKYLQKAPPHTPRAHPPTRVWMGAVFLTLKRTPGEHVFGVAQLIKVLILFVLTNKTAQSVFVCCSWDRTVYCYPQGTCPLKVCYATCLWNIFFSYLRDKWDLHFPLNTVIMPFSPRISDIWSNSNLFSYLTFSNNWALALVELVSIISERKNPYFYSMSQVNRRGWYSVTRIPLIIFGHTQKLLYGDFWVDSLKGWFFFFGYFSLKWSPTL